jgi:hypothetical protein
MSRAFPAKDAVLSSKFPDLGHQILVAFFFPLQLERVPCLPQ